jgi:predicted  nucleic acid-binding Zn-ribbon protein
MAEMDVVIGLLERLTVTVGGMDARLSGLDTRMSDLETRMSGLEVRMSKVEAGQSRLEAEQASMRRDIGLQIERVLNRQNELSDDLTSVMVRLGRMDNATRMAVDEMIATQSLHARLASRVTILEQKDQRPQ